MANYTDSVAVAIVDQFNVLQGVGNKLKHFCTLAGETTVRFYDFQFRDKIHGIRTISHGNCTKIWIYGGRYLALCELCLYQDQDHRIRLITRCKLTDVISSVECNSDYKVLDAVTTYNVALRIQLKEDALEIVHKSVCEERATLYCSHIRYDPGHGSGDWTKVVIFGGTAFGEVLIWRPNESGKSVISYRFSTTRGVLFSITTSPDCKQLFTTSDDRSVRFWKIKWGGKQEGGQLPQGNDLELSCFGHMGRVFRSVKVGELLLSVGEDSRLCGWDMHGMLVFRRDFQSGATLWNLAVDNSTRKVYITTSNGGLEVVGLEEALHENKSICVGGVELFQGTTYPAKIRFLAPPSGNIVCVTSTDELRLLSGCTVGPWVVSCVVKLDFKTTVLEVSGNSIALGGFARVCIYEYDGSKLVLQAQSHAIGSLVRSVHWVQETGQLLAVNDRGEGCLFSRSSLDVLKRINLSYTSQGKERWSTAVLSVNNYLLIGDRHGSLHCFDCNTEEVNAPVRMSLRRVHGSLGITGMERVTDDCILTTGHDGMMRTIHVDQETGVLSIWRSQRVPIKWIDRADDDLVVGFNDNHFTIWSREQMRIVFEMDCGGGHRFWDLSRREEGDQFIYIKNRQLFLANIPLQSNRELCSLPNSISHWHTTSTNCLKVWDAMGCRFVISGGEEGLVKVHELVGDALIYRDEMTSHIANIRSMCLREVNEDTVLLFTGGGRAQMCVQRLEMTVTGLEIRECCNYMLKKQPEGDKGGRKRKSHQVVDFDPETRFMCLLVNGSTIYAGCSDGFIRVFEYDDEKKEITLTRETFYGKCVLQMARLPIDDRLVILTMATDGRINFWADGAFDRDPTFQLVHHESGINAFDCSRAESKEAVGNEFWIVTGGDDQGLVWSKIGYDKGFVLLASYKQPYRHTAQVSGIQIRGNKFLSVSVDQEVLEHSLEGDCEEFRNISFTSVSDAKGLAMVDDMRVLVYGAGVEIIDIV